MQSIASPNTVCSRVLRILPKRQTEKRRQLGFLVAELVKSFGCSSGRMVLKLRVSVGNLAGVSQESVFVYALLLPRALAWYVQRDQLR